MELLEIVLIVICCICLSINIGCMAWIILNVIENRKINYSLIMQNKKLKIENKLISERLEEITLKDIEDE